MIKVNGELFDFTEIPLNQFLEEHGYGCSGRIAVEVNEEIVPKSAYADCVLKDGDVVEVVSFVGGG